MADQPFQDAHYYDCRESEQLQHVTVEEAVQDYLDNLAERDCDMVALIREHSPITVEAYNRKPVSEVWYERQAAALVESAVEAFSKEYCESDDEGVRVPGANRASGKSLMATALKALFADSTSYDCETVGRFQLEAAEVEAMMREYEPTWFESEAPVTPAPVDVEPPLKLSGGMTDCGGGDDDCPQGTCGRGTTK